MERAYFNSILRCEQNPTFGNKFGEQEFRIDVHKHYEIDDLKRLKTRDVNNFVKLLRQTSLDTKSTIDKKSISSLLTNEFISTLRPNHMADVILSIRHYGANCHSDQELCIKLFSHLLSKDICSEILENPLSSCVLSMSRMGLKWDMMSDEAQSVLIDLIQSRETRLNKRQKQCIQGALETICDMNVNHIDVSQQATAPVSAVKVKDVTSSSRECLNNGCDTSNAISAAPASGAVSPLFAVLALVESRLPDVADAAVLGNVSPSGTLAACQPAQLESTAEAPSSPTPTPAASSSRHNLLPFATTAAESDGSGYNEQTVQFLDRLDGYKHKPILAHEERVEMKRIKPRYFENEELPKLQPPNEMAGVRSCLSLPLALELGHKAKGSTAGMFPVQLTAKEQQQNDEHAVSTVTAPLSSVTETPSACISGEVIAATSEPVEIEQPSAMALKKSNVQYWQLSVEKQKELAATVERLASTASAMPSAKYAALLRRCDCWQYLFACLCY